MAGTSLTESPAADSGSVSALCLTSRALLQGLSSESGQRFGALWWIDGTSSAAPHGNVPWMWPSRAGHFTAGPVGVREDGCPVPVSRGSSTAPELSSSLPGCGQCVQTWPQQRSLWAVASPARAWPKLIFRTAAGFGFLWMHSPVLVLFPCPQSRSN